MNLAQEHGVTSQTIRRDLQELESRGLIQQSHGVALPGPGSTAIAYKDRNAHQTELKRRLMARQPILAKLQFIALLVGDFEP